MKERKSVHQSQRNFEFGSARQPTVSQVSSSQRRETVPVWPAAPVATSAERSFVAIRRSSLPSPLRQHHPPPHHITSRLVSPRITSVKGDSMNTTDENRHRSTSDLHDSRERTYSGMTIATTSSYRHHLSAIHILRSTHCPHYTIRSCCQRPLVLEQTRRNQLRGDMLENGTRWGKSSHQPLDTFYISTQDHRSPRPTKHVRLPPIYRQTRMILPIGSCQTQPFDGGV